MQILRIGIIGTGRIAHRFAAEADCVAGVEIAAVYNPRVESAKKFVREIYGQAACDGARAGGDDGVASAAKDVGACHVQHIPQVCVSLEQMWETVDAVYIATPHHTHVSYVKAALEAGKHVLCEKPMAFSKADVDELGRLAESKGLVLMEAIKTAYCPGFQGLLEIIASGRIGTVIDVESCFTKLTPSNMREFWDEKYGGSFVELGTYTLLPIAKILGMNPKQIHFWTRDTLLGCDAYSKVTIDYGTAIATAKTGLAAKSEGQLIVSGTKGYILVPAPWWLTKKVEVHYEDPNQIETYEFPYEGAGLRYEIEAFREAVSETLTGVGIMNQETVMDMLCGPVAELEKSGRDRVRDNLELSRWIADVMEQFLTERGEGGKQTMSLCENADGWKINVGTVDITPRIWAHRGCCMEYPENTLEAFEAAAQLGGLTGIELDIQLTSDGELVVIYDEKVDRTTNGTGEVRNYTLAELQALRIRAEKDAHNQELEGGKVTHIPSLREVFELLLPYCRENGLLINIELKNSVFRYEGMEQKVLEMVREYELEPYIIYSSFLPESVGVLKQLDPKVKTGTLAGDIQTCLSASRAQNADALHPWIGGLDMLESVAYAGYPIRVWNGEEPFFGDGRSLKETHLEKYVRLGATDIITNVPELYLNRMS